MRNLRKPLAAALSLAFACGVVVYSQTTLQVGYLTVTSDPGTTVPVGTALFSYLNSAGVLVSQAGIGSADPILSGRIFVDGAGTSTGLALVNNSGRTASIVLTLRDASGSEKSRQPLILLNRQHLSRYVSQMFSGTSDGFTGSLTIESDSPLAAVTLRDSSNGRGENLYTTLPVIDLAVSSSDPVVFPHIAAGGGYATQLILVNRSSQRIRGFIRLTGDDGRALPLQMGGNTGSEFPYQIEPNGVYRGELESPLDLSVGYAMAVPDPGDSAPSGTAIFQFKSAGQIVTEAGVAATAQTTLARIFVDHAGSRTGLALANPASTAATVDLTLMDRFGSALATTTLTLAAGGHGAAFVDQFFKDLTDGFTGLLEIKSSVPIAPITLKLTTNTRGETILTTLPVADLTRVSAATTLIFPQVALYGGFSTRLIFIHPDTTKASSGQLQFYKEDGTPLTLPMTGQQSSVFGYRFSAGSGRQYRPGNMDAVGRIDLLDGANIPTTEFTVNEGNKARPPLSIRDNAGVLRDDYDVTYTSSNPDVASVDDGIVNAKVRGFSTLTIAAGGVVKAAVITVTGVDTGGTAFGAAPSGLKPAPEGLYLAAADQQTVLLAQSLTQIPVVYAGTQGVFGLKDGPRLQSLFRNPSFVEKGRYDNAVYVSDAANNVIRRIRAEPDGGVETLAGSPVSGSKDGIKAEASFYNPQGIAQDDRGLLWVSDSGNHTIRRINVSTGKVETIAGLAGAEGSTDGQGSAARFRSPMGITVEPEARAQQLQRERRGLPPPPVRVIVADAGNNVLRRVYEDGRVETIGAGAGFALTLNANADPVGSALGLNAPQNVAADSFGTIYVTEPGSKQVRAILPTGQIVAAAEPKTFSQPQGIAVSQSGRIIVGDTRLREIRYGEPQITSITPNHISSRGGVKVTLRGKNFAPGTLIVAGDVVITSITAAESNTETISMLLPALPSGRTTLTVQNRGGLAQIALLVDAIPLTELQVGYITTIAGGSTFAGDGGTAVSAPVTPSSIAVDSNGNLLIADTSNHRIRRVDAKSGIITSVAGNGLYSFSGDGGPAVAASLNTPLGITLDAAGNLFIADSYNQRVRRVDAQSGIISTVAGTGGDGPSGDAGPAIAANLNFPTSVAIDGAGNLFIADTLNNKIRRVDTSGTITTVAGNGQARFAGDNGPGINASLNQPRGISFDRNGNLFIADNNNQRIRKLDRNGIITTVAGSGEYGFSVDGTAALSSMLESPSAVTIDTNGNLLIADRSSRIRKVSATDSRITTVAGNGNFDFSGDGGPATTAAIKEARGVVVDSGGNIFIADSENRNIRRVDARTGIIFTVAGNGEGAFLGENGPATSAVINYPLSIIFDSAGNLLIADSDNRVRKVDMSTGIITIIAGGGGPPDGLGDRGKATEAALFQPSGLAFDRAGNLYISDNGHARVRKVDARTNIITTVAGTGQEDSYGDGGPATSAALKYPRTIAIDSSDNLYISDEGNLRIRKVNLASGVISTYAGTGIQGFSGDGGPANRATFSTVWSFVLDPGGNIYIADYDNACIRRIDRATETVSTYAAGSTDARILPVSVAFNGRLYMMELILQRILRIETNGAITMIAGNGDAGFSGDNGPAIGASISYPAALAFDRFGNLFIADSNNNRIRAVRGPLP